ncbi:MAG TPA: phosphoserine aminotransferase, partial [Alphaproteobacteria bacterium]|nr:phosphoserine aminotransferase [Alphaproteobacteria bacterium]
MLAVEDAIDGLTWAEGVGGLKALIGRSEANLKSMADWVTRTDWVDFLAGDPAIRSSTSICLKIVDPWFRGLDAKAQAEVPKKMAALLEAEGVAYDVNGYRDAPPGLRIWGGSTVETADIEALLPWLDWAFATARAELAQAA